MNAQNLTQKSIEAVNGAKQIASNYGNQQITSLHLLCALLEDGEGISNKIIEKIGVSPQAVKAETVKEIEKLPKVSGASGEYLSHCSTFKITIFMHFRF